MSDRTPMSASNLITDFSNFSEILNALELLNRQEPNSLKAPRQLAHKLDDRGETVESMQDAFAWCQHIGTIQSFLLMDSKW